MSNWKSHARIREVDNALRKSFWSSAFIIIGSAIVGTIADSLLASRFHFLNAHTHVSWKPSVDVVLIQFAMTLSVNVNWGTLAGVLAGVFFVRRKK